MNALVLIALMGLGATPAYAHCPLCTAAAGAGVLASRFLGVDDLIIGIWLGAAMLSMGLWISNSIKKYFKGQGFVISLVLILSIVLPLYGGGFLGNQSHQLFFMMPSGALFGIDRMIIGIIAGVAVFIGADYLSQLVKKKKGLLFSYQTITFIMTSLLLASLIGWWIV